MHTVHKIMNRDSGLDSGSWFESAAGAVPVHSTWSGADPMIIRVKDGRMNVRR
jgi:hypothetical protein